MEIIKRKLSVELTPNDAQRFKSWLRQNGIQYSSHECYCNILIIGMFTESEELKANEFLMSL